MNSSKFLNYHFLDYEEGDSPYISNDQGYSYVAFNRIFPTPDQNHDLTSTPEELPLHQSSIDALLQAISSHDQQQGRMLFLIANENSRDLMSVLVELPEDLFQKIFLIDSGCSEALLSEAHEAGLEIVSAPNNADGGDQSGLVRKLCFDLAQRESASMLVMFELHHTRDLAALPAIVKLIDQEIWDVILGTRFDDFLPMSKRSQDLPHQLGPRRGKQLIADIFYGQRLIDPDTDFLACRIHPLWVLPYHENKDTRVFSWQFIAQTLGAGFRIGELPLRVASSEAVVRSTTIRMSDRVACARTVLKSWMTRFSIWRNEDVPTSIDPLIPPPQDPSSSV